MAVQLTTFGYNKAENQNLILTDENIVIFVVLSFIKTFSGDFLPCSLIPGKLEKSIVVFTFVFLFKVCQYEVL